MYSFIIGVIILLAVLLILAVLVQNSKGGGLANQFGGAGSSQLMGVKRTGDLLEQVTWGLAIALIAFTLSTNFLLDRQNGDAINSVNIERAQEKATLPGGLTPAPANKQPATSPAPATDTTKP